MLFIETKTQQKKEGCVNGTSDHKWFITYGVAVGDGLIEIPNGVVRILTCQTLGVASQDILDPLVGLREREERGGGREEKITQLRNLLKRLDANFYIHTLHYIPCIVCHTLRWNLQ